WPEFSADSSRAYLSLERIIRMRDQDFRLEFGDSALMRAGRAQLSRNAVAVAANLVALPLISTLIELGTSDPSSIVRQQISVSLRKLHSFSDGLDRTRIENFLDRATIDI